MRVKSGSAKENRRQGAADRASTSLPQRSIAPHYSRRPDVASLGTTLFNELFFLHKIANVTDLPRQAALAGSSRTGTLSSR
jgi:hypothetical protein